MFGRKKYKISFDRSIHIKSRNSYSHVFDSTLLTVLIELQKAYNFEIISTNFNLSAWRCEVVIKCRKEDRFTILNSYCNILKGSIENVKMK